MAPRTVQQLYNLKPEELNALTVLSGLEGYRGDGGKDVAAVAANLLSRRLSGKWGGFDIRNIAKAPGQYEAVFNYSMNQLADPTFGARVLGGEAEFNRLRNIVNNPALVGEQFKQAKGAQSFRGVSAYGNKKPTDYMPVPGKSNFYFNPLDQAKYQKGVSMFGETSVPPTQTPPPAAPANTGDFLRKFLTNTLLFGQQSQEPSLGKQLLTSYLQQPLTETGADLLMAGGLTPRSEFLNQLTRL
jgi:hypothetical protein